ncbi:hypothetical protein SAMN06265375_1212 [Muriicola jejuensis]|nr:hypothetical protein SAMN06265375_1212 [Muriicola jejuensis]
MIRSTTIQGNERTVAVVKKMVAMKDNHREKIVKKVKESRKKN